MYSSDAFSAISLASFSGIIPSSASASARAASTLSIFQ